MKRLCTVWICFFSLSCFAQTSIDPYPLQIGFNKTTNLIFSYAVKSVDRGSRDVLIQKAAGIANVLQLKAGRMDFVPTNVSVITADGKLYSFMVFYASDPPRLNLSFAGDSTIHFDNEPVNTALLENEAAEIVQQKHFLHQSTHSELMGLSLQSIYINKQVLWFTLKLHNHSLIDFQPDYIKFFTCDKRKAKRTAEQQIELIPLFRSSIPVVAGNDKKEFAFAFSQFTLSKDKRLVCQVSEQNGGRLLTLHISHKAILKARLLNR